jgi:hypothetical protein
MAVAIQIPGRSNPRVKISHEITLSDICPGSQLRLRGWLTIAAPASPGEIRVGLPSAVSLLDLSACHIVVKEVREVETIKGDRGKTTEASKRGSVLIELEIHGTCSSEGQVGLYPSIFSLTCVYRGVRRIIPSLALFTKPRRPTGEIQPYWLNDPETSMLIRCEEGGEIEFYAVFEVPEEVTEFIFQIPQALQQVSTESP